MAQQPYHYALHKSRLYTRAFATLVLIVSLILEIAATSLCNHEDNNYYYVYMSCISIAGLSGASAALLYNALEFATVRMNKKGFHPGAHIAIDLCLVAWLATASSFDITFNISYYYYTSGLRANTSMVAAGGLESAAAVLHFVLFVMACVAVHKWRHEPERILEALKKAPGRSANSAPLYPTGPVKWIPLRGKTEGVPLMLVYYVQEGDVQEGESPSPAYAEVDVKGWDLKNLGEKDV